MTKTQLDTDWYGTNQIKNGMRTDWGYWSNLRLYNDNSDGNTRIKSSNDHQMNIEPLYVTGTKIPIPVGNNVRNDKHNGGTTETMWIVEAVT